jgi:pyrroloquinoline quinone (PQQ) biosynthesis protein C
MNIDEIAYIAPSHRVIVSTTVPMLDSASVERTTSTDAREQDMATMVDNEGEDNNNSSSLDDIAVTGSWGTKIDELVRYVY